MIDAAEILAVEEFTVAVILPNGAGAVRGVFENQSANPMDINTVAPNIALATAVADALNEDDLLRIDGREYVVRDKEYDDAGLTIVNLGT